MHVRQLPSGHWRWIVQHAGERRNGTAKDKPHALLAGSQALVEMGADHPADVESTVGDLLAAWQAEGADSWSPTYAADVAAVCARLPAEFLLRDTKTVTPAIISTLQRTLARTGWSVHRIARARRCISAAFMMGVDYGWATRNPTRDTRTLEVPETGVVAPDVAAVKRLVSTAPAKLHLFVWLAANTAARRGELLALRWSDLDADGVLTIHRSVVQVNGGAVIVREQTKTGRGGDRRLELDEHTVGMLHAHHDAQRALAAEQSLPAPVYVFSHTAGQDPWRPGYISLAYRRHRAAAVKAALTSGEDELADAMRQVRLHDMRHYVATTMLLIDKESVVDVAAQLGHAKPTTTMRVYAHYLPGRGKESATRRSSRLLADD